MLDWSWKAPGMRGYDSRYRYDKLGAEYKDSSSVLIADVDCTKEDKLCGDKGVQGYPTIKYYTAETGKDGTDYNSGRDYDSLVKFVQENLEVKCLTSDPKECSVSFLALRTR
jgi:protein disulfide-isomerase A6